jgi:hypothetical protein
MIDFEAKKKEIEEKWKPCAEACNSLLKALNEFRAISLDGYDKDNMDEIQTCMSLGRDIDNRTVYILRSLLV